MKPLPFRIITAALLLVLGSLLGWALNPIQRTAPSPVGASPGTIPTKSTRSAKSTSQAHSSSAPEFALLQSIREAPTEQSRILASLNLARTLPLSEAGKWLEQGLFSQREGFALTAFNKALKERWQIEDPEGYGLWEIGTVYPPDEQRMAELADANPELLLARIRLITDENHRTKALATLAQSRPDLALAELAKLDYAALANSYRLRETFKNIALKDPSSLEGTLDELPSALRNQAQTALYSLRLNEDFKTALAELQEEPLGLDLLTSSFSNFPKIANELLDSFTSLPPSWKTRFTNYPALITQHMSPQERLSTDWESLGFSAEKAGQIRAETLYDTVRKEKVITIEEFEAANLNLEATQQFFNKLLSRKKHQIIDELLPHLDQGTQDYIASKKEHTPTLAYTDATDFAKVVTGEDAQSQRSDFNKQLGDWDKAELKRFTEDYQVMEGERRRNLNILIATAYGSEIDNLALEIQTQAIEELASNPESFQQLDGNQSMIRNISKLAMSKFDNDSTAATTWVQNLPEGEGRQWAMKNIAARWSNFEPDAARDWVNQLPATDRTAVLKHLED